MTEPAKQLAREYLALEPQVDWGAASPFYVAANSREHQAVMLMRIEAKLDQLLEVFAPSPLAVQPGELERLTARWRGPR